jgi:hypothetical protein
MCFQLCNRWHIFTTRTRQSFHPIGFYFRNFFLAKINNKIHDKEFLAIVDAFEEWCHLFERVQHEITMYSNHKNLQYFMIARVLN